MSAVLKKCVRRRALSWPLFGLTLGALIAGTGAAQAAPVLPTGGKVVSGSAAIGPAGPGALIVTQSSSKAILDWSSFSIGKGGKVAFDNGSGATLNRVTGTSVSSLNGLLSATGSVYLINPNGVIIGRSGVVDVGGTFVASTLDTSDAGFLKGGALGFSGASTAQVVNLGKVGALGGDVALIAAVVSNTGSISAAKGSAGLLAGHGVVMLRDEVLDQGRFSVLLGGPDTSVTNIGLIASANAELRAEGGNVYALAGDTAGVIRATGVKSGGGKVWLVAEGGELDLGGAISAQGSGATAGAIETSGGRVSIGNAKINAHGGTWLVDPYDLNIDATAAATIDGVLNAGTSVIERTTANGYSGAGVANSSGKGDITVAAPIAWNTTAGLTLSAYRDIDVEAKITASGGGALTLVTDNSGAGDGGAVLLEGGSIQFTGASGAQPTGALAIGVGTGAPTAYTLVSDLATLATGIAANTSGAFALATTVDGSNGGQGYSTIPLASTANTSFTGTLDGLGNSIRNLSIVTSHDHAGLFGLIGAGGTVRNLVLDGGSVTEQFPGSGSIYVDGSLAGQSAGSIFNVSSTTAVHSNNSAGGLIGVNLGSITDAHTTGSVSGSAGAGGLVYQNNGTVSTSYASGAVQADDSIAGGLVGVNEGALTSVHAVGAVSSSFYTGGLAGSNAGSIVDAYATGAIVGGFAAGGLVGSNEGSISKAFASGAVTNYQGFAGGLVGEDLGSIQSSYAAGSVTGRGTLGGLVGGIYTLSNIGPASISQSYATGAVSALNQTQGPSDVGGLVGSLGEGATILQTYATGAVSAANAASSGGLIGAQNTSTSPGKVSSSYYDTQTTGQTTDAGGALGLTTDQFMNASSPIGGLNLGTTQGLSSFVIVDSDGTLNGANGTTRPLLLSEYSTTITNAHQLQLMALNLSASYTLASNIDASGTSNPSDVWGPAGFAPLGQASTPFTGVLNGVGHTLASLTINRAGATDVGLIGSLGAGGAAESLTLSGNVVGGTDVGALVGYNAGMVSGASGKATVTGSSQVGGLVGYSSGAVSGSSGKGAVTGSSQVGGLLGYSSGAVTGSHATGAVNSPGSDGVQLGGLIGVNDGNVSGAYATGAVQGASQIGGLVGVNNNGVSNSYATGAVTGGPGASGAGSGASIGGLVGENTGGLGGDTAYGAVSGLTQVGGLVGLNDRLFSYARAANPPGSLGGDAAHGAVNGHSQVGGLVGRNDGFIGSSSATGAVQGYNQVGGLVGYNSGQGGNGVSFTVASSYATGAVNGSSGKGTPAGAGGQIGGLIGENRGLITQDYATGAVNGSSQIGGLVGLDDDYFGEVYYSYATGAVGLASSGATQVGGLIGSNGGLVVSVYATGAVGGSSVKGALVGVNDATGSISTSYATGQGGSGFAGTNSGTFTSDVFDAGSTATSLGVGSGSSSGLTAIGGSTGLDPYQASSYAGFDFNRTWTIQAGSSRPYLIVNPQAPPPS